MNFFPPTGSSDRVIVIDCFATGVLQYYVKKNFHPTPSGVAEKTNVSSSLFYFYIP